MADYRSIYVAVIVAMLASCAMHEQRSNDRSVSSVNTNAAALGGQNVSVIGHGVNSFGQAELWGNLGMRMHGYGDRQARARECIQLRDGLAGPDIFASGAPRYRITGKIYIDKPRNQPIACNSGTVLIPELVEPLDYRTPYPRP
ncbi:hypothetical protein [Sphingopyxis sp. LK2115]|jgi:hypothetical protein|uniref:hypothetical protein n=1 Tax=Sphingopyxis sp. LK2115 TaxID=2744558 RepID=UPI00166160FF|nr:hypothetical protein [Sphingopyxis sp. LK2115]